MFTISVDPIIVNFGGFAIRWYSLILLAAIAVAVWLTAREAERRGHKKDDVYEIAGWVVGVGWLWHRWRGGVF